MYKAKVEALHNEFTTTIRPILQAQGRNNVYKVAQFISRNIRSDIDELDQAERIIGSCSRSRTMALQIWISDLKKIRGEQIIDDIMTLIRFYKKRAALNDIEKTHYEKLRKAEAIDRYGGDIA